MCQNLQEGNSQEEFNEELLSLFKKFKEGNEREAGEPIDNETLKVDFSNYITENISKIVDDDTEIIESANKCQGCGYENCVCSPNIEER